MKHYVPTVSVTVPYCRRTDILQQSDTVPLFPGTSSPSPPPLGIAVLKVVQAATKAALMVGMALSCTFPYTSIETIVRLYVRPAAGRKHASRLEEVTKC